jgi:hypothetical protein
MDFEAVWSDGALGSATLGTSNDRMRHAGCNPEDARSWGEDIWDRIEAVLYLND